MHSRILLFAALVGFAFPVTSPAQNLLSNPESIVYDPARRCYLVSNWGDDGPGDKGAIVRIDEHHEQSYFNTDLVGTYGIAGLYILDDCLLAAAGNYPDPGVAVFSLETAELLEFITIPGIGLPNDITSDSTGVVYVTDYWGDALYSIVDGTPSLMFDHGLYNPNGILYDRWNHRLLTLAATVAGCPVMEISLEDSTIHAITQTGFYGYDGIVADSEGRVYISEWTDDAIHRYDEPFTSPHVVFSSGHTDPADIYYDAVHDLICVPNFSTHTIDFVPVDPSGVETGMHPDPAAGITVWSPYPRPSGDATTLRYELPAAGTVAITICDVQGRAIREVARQWQGSGYHEQRIDVSDLAAGMYHYRLECNGRARTGAIVHVR